MFGTNPVRQPLKGNGMELEVKHIFPTLQGEGPFVGFPSVFIRLGGCNLTCKFCDTEFEDFNTMSAEAIVAKVKELSVANDGKTLRRLVVITGGEPFRQPIEHLCQKLIDAEFDVQIETNGTLYRDVAPEVEIVCSPKNPNNAGYAVIRDDLLSRVLAIKFVISAHLPGYNDVAEVGQSVYGTPVYVQPMDEYDAEKNARNIKLASELAQKHGYRVSLQMHKMLGIE